MPWPTLTAAPICHVYAVLRYEPKPVVVSRGSIIAIAWNGAPIHQSMDWTSVVAVVELTKMLLFCPAMSPARVYWG